MNVPGKNTGQLLAGILLVCSQAEACRQPDDRCLPIRYCPPYFNRTTAREHITSGTSRSKLGEFACVPEERIDRTLHVCCPKESIRCSGNGKPGICALPELCPSFRNTKARNVKLTNDATLCYTHNNENYVCCPSASEDAVEPRRAVRSIRSSPATHSESAFPSCSYDATAFRVSKALCDSAYTHVRGSSKACCKLPKTDTLISHPNAAKLAEAVTCGRQAVPVFTTRILVGNETDAGEFPWMVLLVYQERVRAFCGGTLIHPRYVLTAAHCIKRYPRKLLKVRLGEHDLTPADADRAVQEISIKEEIAHDRHDVALLKLRHSAELVPGVVEPICLPITKRLLMHLPATLVISGWGKTEHPQTERRTARLLDQSHPLLKANVHVRPESEECTQDYEVCAGGPGFSNTCYGDSGGPYQAASWYMGSERYVQYAVISSGPAYCESPDRPSRGMLVAYFVPWILDVMEFSRPENDISPD